MVEVLQEKVIVLGLDVRVAEEGLTDRRILQHDEGGDDDEANQGFSAASIRPSPAGSFDGVGFVLPSSIDSSVDLSERRRKIPCYHS